MGQEDKSLYLSAKDFNSSVAKGNVQTKADVEEKAKDRHSVLNLVLRGSQDPLYKEGRK